MAQRECISCMYADNKATVRPFPLAFRLMAINKTATGAVYANFIAKYGGNEKL